MHQSASILILGIGNVLWADEGFGVRAVEALHRHYEFPDNVRLMDGGTQGIYLVQHVREANILVVFDAVDYGLEPGAIKLVEGDAVPNFLGAKKVSLHQTGFQEVLAMAGMLGDYPQHLLLVGVQPEQLEDYGGSLRPLIKSRIQPAIDAALEWLGRHDIHASRRPVPLGPEQSLAGSEIDLWGRPDLAFAVPCHQSDARPLTNDQVDRETAGTASDTQNAESDERAQFLGACRGSDQALS